MTTSSVSLHVPASTRDVHRGLAAFAAAPRRGRERLLHRALGIQPDGLAADPGPADEDTGSTGRVTRLSGGRGRLDMTATPAGPSATLLTLTASTGGPRAARWLTRWVAPRVARRVRDRAVHAARFGLGTGASTVPLPRGQGPADRRTRPF